MVPNSVLMIPLFYNLLPIAWFKNCQITFPTLTTTSFDSIEHLKKGMEEIHRYSELGGEVLVNNLDNLNVPSSKGNSTMLFSGGVDSWCSFISHIKEKPTLCTVWGADVKLFDEEGWNLVDNDIEMVANKFKVQRYVVKTNFRDMLNYFWLEDKLDEVLTGNWWHDVQHGMGLTSLFAPLCYINDNSVLYVPGTFSQKWLQPIASEPRIDNFVKLGNTNVFHDQFDKNRMDKIKVIVDYYKKKKKAIPLRVCFEGRGGQNCCRCEKCNRTILALLITGVDPTKFGFEKYDLEYIKNCLISKKWKFGINNVKTYQDMQVAVDFSIGYNDSLNEFLIWFSNYDIYKLYVEKKKNNLTDKVIYFLRKVKYTFKRYI